VKVFVDERRFVLSQQIFRRLVGIDADDKKCWLVGAAGVL
jgi:hypothetical protein